MYLRFTVRSTDLLILDVQVKSENPDLEMHMKIYSNISLFPALISFSTYTELYSKHKLRILYKA